MLKIEQYEGDLFVIQFETPDGVVKFSSVFKQVDEINPEDLVPSRNGMSLMVKLPGEE